MLPCMVAVPIDGAGTEKGLLQKQDVVAQRFLATLGEQGQVSRGLVGQC